MKVLSINVGLPREVEWEGRTFPTSIFKQPVEGPVRLRALNLEGDQQANPKFHGGPEKVVYAYPSEHYAFWKTQLSGMEMPWGSFGENLTTEGLDERFVHIGDVFRLGTAELRVTLPRMPCHKLAMRFRRPEIVQEFLESQRSGFYCGVQQEGIVEAGDTFQLVRSDPHRLRVVDVVRLKSTARDERELLEQALDTPALPESWREEFQRQLEKL